MINNFKTETTIEFRRAVRKACEGQYRNSGRGRTDYGASVTQSTPIEVIVGSDAPPKVVGLGYWKTGFRNGAFQKTLYTYSTFRIVVGENWKP